VVIQMPGEGWRIAVADLSRMVAERPEMRGLFLRYIQTLWTQTAFTAHSNAVHQVNERVARWILMSHDRSDGHKIALTHDFLSLMLAVRRSSVTTALHILEGNRLIHGERGTIVIRDRAALEDFASDAYGIPEQEYERLIGPFR
jgi:CRP-like cAMP-binding protein